jgi:hypothetical protein
MSRSWKAFPVAEGIATVSFYVDGIVTAELTTDSVQNCNRLGRIWAEGEPDWDSIDD